MSSMDLSKVPVALPPEGYTARFDDPPTRHRVAGIVICMTGTALSTLFILLRVYTKMYLAKRFGVDDAATLLAWLLSVTGQVMIAYLWANKYLGVHIWDLYLPKANLTGQFLAVCNVIYIPLMALAKLSLLLFYRKLSPERWFKWFVWAVTGFIICYSAAMFLAFVFACAPLKMNWDITNTSGHCASKRGMLLATAALNATTETLLLLIPMPMVLKLRVPTSQKIGVIAMFGVGSLTLVTSLVRISLLRNDNLETDLTWNIATPALWICVESSLVIICGCLPVLRLFFRHIAPDWIGESTREISGEEQPPATRSVAQLSNMDAMKPSVKENGRAKHWEDWWEKDPSSDSISQELVVLSNGQVVQAKEDMELKKVRSNISYVTCRSDRTDPNGPKFMSCENLE